MRQFLNKKKSFSIEDGQALQDSLAFIEVTLQKTGLGNKLALRCGSGIDRGAHCDSAGIL